jgi:hypothetical protein
MICALARFIGAASKAIEWLRSRQDEPKQAAFEQMPKEMRAAAVTAFEARPTLYAYIRFDCAIVL